MAHAKKTGNSVASQSSKLLRSGSTSKAAKSIAGSALSQSRNTKVTSASAASKAGKVLGAKTSSKAIKSAAASALSQRHKGKG